MTDRQIIVLGGVIGAVAGMAAGYMFFTPEGRRWRVEAERNLSALIQEAERVLAAADQVRQSVEDLRDGQTGWVRTA